MRQYNMTHDERQQHIQHNTIDTQKVNEGSINITIRIKQQRPNTNKKYVDCTFVIFSYTPLKLNMFFATHSTIPSTKDFNET